jgi:hypothetical protein
MLISLSIFLFLKSIRLTLFYQLHNEELHNLYSSPSIFIVVKWKSVSVQGIVQMGEENMWDFYVNVRRKEAKRKTKA